ncbi:MULTISPECIES: glycosyltransferase [Butyricimonas]|uniref:glycosyltransferase n=1 Tax=Butyricimonas TaxID=574697 RepID=UPI0007FB22B6|nr:MULTISPECIES: glycosyltransferase [Butyricimonas]
MADLLFFTDRYPYNNSEAFIENEITIMAQYFDNIYCLPCGLMVETNSIRAVPDNVHVLKPSCSDNIYQNKPSRLKKNVWAIRNLGIWFILCLFYKEFYIEIWYLVSKVGFTFPRFLRIFRTLAPAIRNKYHYGKILKNEGITDYYAYSYWLEPSIMFADDMLPNSTLKKTFCRSHRWDLYVEESPINYLAFQKQVVSYMDQVYVISNDGVKYLKNLYPEYESKILLSRLGTLDWGVNPDKSNDFFRIVSCSNLIPVKRVELIIDMLANLSENYTNIEWIHFGSGQYYEYISRYAEKKLKKNHFEFMGIVPNSQIMEYYQNNHVDVFVNVSSSEGIPVSIMEACSCGIPVIATNVGGTSEIVHDKQNGYLLDKNFKLDTFTNCIEDLIQNEYKLNDMRKQSRQIWKNLFFCETNYHEFYNSVIKV